MNRDLIFKAREAAKIMDWQPEEVTRVGQYIAPEVPGNGKGHHALYSFRNLIEMRISEYLGKFGVPQKRIQKYIADLRSSKHGWLEEDGPEGLIALDDTWEWAAGSDMDSIMTTLSQRKVPVGIIIVNLGAIKRALRMSLESSTIPISEE